MRRLGSILRALFTTVAVGLLAVVCVGPSLWVELEGELAPAEVVAKHEEISPKTVNWSRELTLDLSYRPAGADERTVAHVLVDPATYDAVAVESTVQLRYLRAGDDLLRMGANMLGARLTSQPPYGPLVARIGGLAPYLAGAAVIIGMLWAGTKWRQWWLAGLGGVLLLAGAFVAVSGWQPPLPPGPVREGTAAVRAVTRIERVGGGRRSRSVEAVQPFLLVELAFVPEGRPGQVIAVDLVDDGSVPGLERGAEVAIRYSAADPRRAQIEGATRTFPWKNLASGAIPILFIGALLVVGLLLRLRRRPRPGGAARP